MRLTGNFWRKIVSQWEEEIAKNTKQRENSEIWWFGHLFGNVLCAFMEEIENILEL